MNRGFVERVFQNQRFSGRFLGDDEKAISEKRKVPDGVDEDFGEISLFIGVIFPI